MSSTPQQKREVWLESDLEPDDVLALYVLAQRGFHPRYIVVGEGVARTKERRMQQYLALLRTVVDPALVTTILRGHDSDKVFADDGKEFSSPASSSSSTDCKDAICSSDNKDSALSTATCLSTYAQSLQTYLTSTPAPLMVILKPPRELTQILKSADASNGTGDRKDGGGASSVNFEPKAAQLLSKCELWLYGGFNLRCLAAKKDTNSANDHNWWLQRFARVWLYESFHATGQRNSIHDRTMPRLYGALRRVAKSSSYVSTLFRLIALWNRHIVAEAQADCRRLEERSDDGMAERQQPQLGNADGDELELQRSRKIVQTVGPFVESQMVLADFALVAVADCDTLRDFWQAADVSWTPAGYSVLKPNERSRIRVCCNIEWATLESVLTGFVRLSVDDWDLLRRANRLRRQGYDIPLCNINSDMHQVAFDVVRIEREIAAASAAK